jgi:hypothetical protein
MSEEGYAKHLAGEDTPYESSEEAPEELTALFG